MSYHAWIGVGSNMSNRSRNIWQAIIKLNANSNTSVVNSSYLYETVPMYKLDQNSFLNAVVSVKTSLTPETLLTQLQLIESELGRDESLRSVPNGPRPIDMDILVYKDLRTRWNSERLTVPHPRLCERSFVLQPLRDCNPEMVDDLTVNYPSISSVLSSSSARRVLPLWINGDEHIWYWGDDTKIMGILNCTPDSFSDGAPDSSVDLFVERALQMAIDGAAIIDVGGESSRPGAQPVDVDEELRRVIPVIERIRSHSDARLSRLPISIDTYKAEVARKAVQCGANIVNDISAGTYDPQMLQTVYELGVPCVLMHVRGRPDVMTSYSEYDDVCQSVHDELKARVDAAFLSGVARWNVVVDPGLGFAKKPPQSFELLRSISSFPPYNLPMLVGPSRKGFIGEALRHNNISSNASSNERMWGTTAVVGACAIQGVDIVRVHDVHEMMCVVSVASCLRPRTN